MCVCVRVSNPGVTDSCELQCGCWELNLSPLEEQPRLWSYEPSLLSLCDCLKHHLYYLKMCLLCVQPYGIIWLTRFLDFNFHEYFIHSCYDQIIPSSRDKCHCFYMTNSSWRFLLSLWIFFCKRVQCLGMLLSVGKRTYIVN